MRALHTLLCLQIYKKMLKVVLLTLLIVAISVALLGVKVFFFKNGRFPHYHISGNKEMYKRGITCVESQDKAARQRPLRAVDEVLKAVD